MDTDNAQDPRETRANELYWESDESVNHIADALDLSKGTLYGMIHPLAADLACPRCHAGMEYANRTARDRGLLTCPACGLEQEEVVVRDEWEDATARRRSGDMAAEPPLLPGAGARPGPDTGRVFAGSVLLAVAAGFLLGRLTKRT